jgi:hypothetical protein
MTTMLLAASLGPKSQPLASSISSSGEDCAIGDDRRQPKLASTIPSTVISDIALLEARMTQIPPAPTNIADVMLSAEIRAHVARQASPIEFALKSVSDARVLGALIHAPAALSGLTDDQLALVRGWAREALHPEQTALQKKLTSALGELKKGLGATKRMIFEAASCARIAMAGFIRPEINRPQPRQPQREMWGQKFTSVARLASPYLVQGARGAGWARLRSLARRSMGDVPNSTQ